jgi:hypothetical protein
MKPDTLKHLTQELFCLYKMEQDTNLAVHCSQQKGWWGMRSAGLSTGLVSAYETKKAFAIQ